ncbi:hypothetical protein J4558_19140 [Leptolyngbya sp. 15MV]|nr:hypothetical protein J4558_19140 [Leptolyngbya sp. 15MV]
MGPTPHIHTIARAASAAILGIAVLCGGCGGSPQIVDHPAYPASAPRGPTLDIQVVRRGAAIELTNTTAQAIGPSTLWLNGRYGRDIGPLGVGQSRRLDLREFVDQWGDRFRAGGFFATELRERLVKAELQPQGGGPMLGLVVIRESE